MPASGPPRRLTDTDTTDGLTALTGVDSSRKLMVQVDHGTFDQTVVWVLEPTRPLRYSPWSDTTATAATGTGVIILDSWPSTRSNTTDLSILVEDFVSEEEAARERARVTSKAGYARLLREGRQRPSPPPAAHARKGFQQMARIPCYRGTRTR